MSPITILLLNKVFSKKSLRILGEEGDFKLFEGIRPFSRIEDFLSRQKVDLVITKVKGLQDLHEMRRLVGNGKDHKVVVMGDMDRDTAFEFIKSGVKGFLGSHIPPVLLKKAIRVIHKGEVWYDRKTASKVFEEFAARLASERSQHQSIEYLSKREKEVLDLVAKGSKNKEIAETLYISEKTVKFHLYNIFEKLGVKDRLNAALFVRKTKS